MPASRDPLGGRNIPCSKKHADEALALMEKALGLLDASNGPDDAGAHLDLAIHRLKAWIEDRPS